MRALIVIPTYDERENLPTLLERALAAEPRADFLVIDDGSPDGTGELAEAIAAEEPRVAVHHRTGKLGLGSAYRYGLTRGLADGYDVVGEMDADHSHDPGDLPRLLAAIETGADVAIGSRYVPGGGVEGWPRRRLALSWAGNAYVRLLTGLPVRDGTAGYRLYRANVIERLDMSTVHSDGYGFQLEMALRAWQAGFAVVEVPITFTERRAGASKLGFPIVAEALVRALSWGVAIRTGRWRP